MSRFTLGVGVALLVLQTSLAVVLVWNSNHESSPAETTALAVTAGVAFIVSGLIALWRRPENRTGIYLAAVGYLWFFGALSDSNNPWIFIVGFVSLDDCSSMIRASQRTRVFAPIAPGKISTSPRYVVLPPCALTLLFVTTDVVFGAA